MSLLDWQRRRRGGGWADIVGECERSGGLRMGSKRQFRDVKYLTAADDVDLRETCVGLQPVLQGDRY